MTPAHLRRMGYLLAVFLGALLFACSSSEPPDDAVHVVHTKGEVGPIIARYLDRAIDKAEDTSAQLVVIELDTPGGLSTSMEEIVKRILEADVPIAVYVTPPGGKAASAGTFIAMAAHIAAMAPNTRIGAASAVNADGSDIEGALGRKIENDAVALIRALAEERGRNADWAESAVRDAVADNAEEAARVGAVDLVAPTLDDLLASQEGRVIRLREGVTFQLTGITTAERYEVDLSTWERILAVLANPTLASILISLGFLGVIFELSNPGLFLPGVFGAIAIILGFLGLGVLPVNTVGIVLIALALLLFALELAVPSGGILGAGGVVALLIGGVVAFAGQPAEVQPNRIVIGILLFFVIGMFVALAVGLARFRKLEGKIGADALVGQVAVARTRLSPEGYVWVQGERWRASLESGAANEGERLRVTGADGLFLKVQKEHEE
ncbi:MAG: nodulation protein NfeD [Dehalococcoidia bacterium]